MPPKNWSIVAWATVAAASVIFSYLFTLGLGLFFIGAGLLLLSAMAQNASLGLGLLVVFSFTVGFTVLWSLIPRKTEFKAPGVLIDLSREGAFRAEIAAIAGVMKESMPSEVYLTPVANAGVARCPGGRRVMLIGLPLLQILTVSQFRAILAHEFAHYYAGDTRLGPWVLRARNNMAKVLNGLGQKNALVSFLTRWGIMALVHAIVVRAVVLNWKLFTRVTQYISRRQEFRCDELACHIAGSASLAQGLCNVEGAAPFLGAYLTNVVIPMAVRGFHPPLADGFSRFSKAPTIEQVTASILRKSLASGKTKVMDSHPPLNARLERARGLAIRALDEDQRPAICLINDLPSLELKLLKTISPQIDTAQLRPMDWESAGAEIYIPLWRKDTNEFKRLLGRWTLADLPEVLRNLPELASHVPDPPGMLLTREQRASRVAGTISIILLLALIDHGWQLHFQPGHFYAEMGDEKVETGGTVQSLLRGKMTAASWDEYCARLGIGDWPLNGEAAITAGA